MATEFKILDPVQGLIDYTNDIKPYHSKVIEALIEYVGTESMEVTVLEEFEFEVGLLYEFDGNFICLIGGYGTPSFGDPVDILVLSPDVSKTILEYPAIGPGFFIVLGDRTPLFDPSIDAVLNIASFIDDRLADVNAISSGSPIGSPPESFTVFGNKTSEYTAGVDIEIIGSAFNNADYTVTGSTFVSGGTRITVNETIPTNNVEGFVRRIDVTNTGPFAIVNSTFEDRHLIPHTTVFVTGISLSAPTLTDSNQRFIATIGTPELTYDAVLSYSNALRHITGSPASTYYVADEGIVVTNIVAVSSSPVSVSILGDFRSSNVFIGDEFYIEDSTGNNGTYNITSMVYEFNATVNDFVTTFGVAALVDVNVDGVLKLNIPSNVFIINDNDYRRFFTQGIRITVTSGSHIGAYTTMNSKYINDKTYVRVRETLIPEGTGRNILSTGSNYIVVDGNVESIYGGSPAQQFNIVTSEKNDGLYTTTTAVYSALTNTTQIGIAEPFDVTDNTGEIHEFTAGVITHLPEGFGATVDVCALVPQALSISSILEDFDILLGHKFVVDGANSATNKLYIADPSGYVFDIFTTLSGSPPTPVLNTDKSIEIISSGGNNGTYTITAIDGGGSPPAALVELTVSTSLQDSGTFSGSPVINGGFLLYKNWWQYYVVDIPAGSPNYDFIVLGDATSDVSTSFQHIFTGNVYTVNSVVFDALTNTTTITVNEDIETTKPLTQIEWVGSPPTKIDVPVGSPPIVIDITAGSPAFDDWIISV